MGAPQSKGAERLSQEDQARVFTLPDGVWLLCSDRFADDALAGFRFLTEAQLSRARAALGAGLTADCDRAVGCLLGLAVGDALGAPLEFHPVRYPDDRSEAHDAPRAGFDPALWKDKSEMRETNRFLLQMGQWTDDTAMALCLADSLLAHDGFHPRDLRLRFLAWWRLGYNNAFGLDCFRSEVWGSRASIGLGGIVGESMAEFSRTAADYTQCGSLHSSGNGSIMRNAPVPIMYHRDVEAAMEAAWRQSKTTHLGDEAADCARLLTWICVRAIVNGAGKSVLADLSDFPARLYSTTCLAAAEQERRHKDNSGEDLADRDWRWRDRPYRYSPKRAAEQPGYVGGYCMDCLAMALHCVHVTEDFEGAVARAADLCGDADTVAAVTGQLAGAIYGASAIPGEWRRVVERWDQGDIACRAWLLYTAEAPAPPAAREQPNGGKWSFTTSAPDAAEEEDEEPPLPASGEAPPLQCGCGRRFGSQTMLKLHCQGCRKKDGVAA